MRRRLVFTLPLFSLKQFSFLVVEIDTDDPEGVTDTISSEKRIRPAKRRRALATCRFLVILLSMSVAPRPIGGTMGSLYKLERHKAAEASGISSPCDILHVMLMHVESSAAGICAPTR